MKIWIQNKGIDRRIGKSEQRGASIFVIFARYDEINAVKAGSLNI
jgi:hypothetical protein